MDPLLLYKPQPHEHTNANTAVSQRLRLFRSGEIRSLWDTRQEIPPRPIPVDQPHFASDSDTCQPAQTLANNDNFRAAHQRLQSTLPLAHMTDHVKHVCQQLYPPRTHPTSHHNRPQTRQGKQAQDPDSIALTDDTLLKALSAMKPGTAFGPFCDYTDTLKEYGLSSPDQSPNPQRLGNLRKLIELVLHNQLPPEVRTLASHCRFLALHKDQDNLDKLRPIGIGTALRRLASATVTAQFTPIFARKLMPEGQFGLAVRGGLDFIAHSATAQYDHHIATPTQKGQPPTRACLLIDFTNCWNRASRDSAETALRSDPDLRPILPYFHCMYNTPNNCFFQRPDGSIDSFQQQDGFPQGDPLSPALSCLVIHQVLQPINAHLRRRAADRRRQHNPGDDGMGSKSALLAYFDDSSAFLPYEDLPSVISQFLHRGPPHGVILNTLKTQILTIPASTAPTATLSPDQQRHLDKATQLLNGDHSITTEGVRLLGQPIGTSAFRRTFLLSAAQAFDKATQRLIHRLDDKQTKAQLFRYCTLPSITHLLAADFLLTAEAATPAPTPQSLAPHHSPFLTALTATTHTFFRHITNTNDPFPPLARLIAHLPIRDGGLGFRDHATAAPLAFLLPLLRTVRYATQGIPTASPTEHLQIPPVYAKPFSSWQSCRHPTLIVHTFRHYLPTLLPHLPSSPNMDPPQCPLRHLATTQPLQGLSSRIYRSLFQRKLRALQPTLPPDLVGILPSLLSPTTSTPLHSLPRRFSDHRWDNDAYRLLISRKLRLPLFSTTVPQCPFCRRPLDRYGDHLFSCGFSAKHKHHLHNQVRDSLFSVLQTIAPLSTAVRTSHDVLREPSQRLPSHPGKRPLDICLDLASPTDTGANAIGIDVTIPHIASRHASRSHPSIPAITRTHIASIRAKFQGRQSPSSSAESLIDALNHHRIALFPFTVDHLGGLGPFALSLLFHHSTSPIAFPPAHDPTIYRFSHAAAAIAHNRAAATTPAICHWASQAWTATTALRYGATHHTSTPQQWAFQSMSLNISSGLVTFLQRALLDLSRAQPTSPSRRLLVSGRLPPRFASPTAATLRAVGSLPTDLRCTPA